MKYAGARKLLVIILLALAGWGEFAAAKPLREVSLQLRWHHQFQFAGYYVAKDLGYYASAGLNVIIRPGFAGISPTQEVGSGRATFGIDNTGLLQSRANGLPVKALAAIFQRSPLRLITLADKDFRDVRSLHGKRVMLLPDKGSLALEAMLVKLGLADSIQRVDSSHSIEDLIDGKTDAFNGYATNEPYTLEQRKIDYQLIDPAAFGIEFYSDILFSLDQTVSREPHLVRDFVRASIKGWEFAFRYPSEAIRITKRYAANKSLNHLRFEANATRELVMPDLISIGHMNRARWDNIQTQLLELGTLQRRVNLDSFIYRADDTPTSWRQILPYLGWIVALLAGLVAVALYHVNKSTRLEKEVSRTRASEAHAYQLATHDHLTGLPNRMLLMDHLEGSIARGRRTGATPFVGFVDLDDFKLVNDRLGHAKGDSLLRAIATRVMANKRSTDTFGRYAGDEFLLMGDDTTALDARCAGERLLEHIMAAIKDADAPQGVGASIGITILGDLDNIDANMAVKLADLLMYEVKRRGKHGVLVREYRDGNLAKTEQLHLPLPCGETRQGDAEPPTGAGEPAT